MAEVMREDDEELVIVEPGEEPEAQEDDAPAAEADEHDDDADSECTGEVAGLSVGHDQREDGENHGDYQ